MVSKGTRKSVDKTPDIRAVAALAKVSIATVSRTINGSPVVSERLSKRVWQAIEHLNYFPNTHARTFGLLGRRSRLFGIIVENITNPFFPELIQSFEEIAVAHGYEILVSSSNSDPAVLTTCIRRMLERKVEGVAVLTFGEEEPVLDQLAFRDIPIVLAEFKLSDPKASTILLDYFDRHPRSRGSPCRCLATGKKVGYLAGPHKLHSAVTRENDFHAAMQAAGLTACEEMDHRVRSHTQGRRCRLRKTPGLRRVPPPFSAPRHDRHRRLCVPRTCRDCASRRTAAFGNRPGRHRFCRVHLAAAHNNPALAIRSRSRCLRGSPAAGRGTHQTRIEA